MVETGCKSRNKNQVNSSLPSVGGIVAADFGLDTDAEGYLIDANGDRILDASGRPVHINDVSQDGSGNLIGPDGSILTDANGIPYSYIGGAMPAHEMGEQIMQGQFQQVFFPYDSNHIIPSERSKVEQVADYLRRNGNAKVIVEGHCDERGSRDYNLALGERRALSVRDYLMSLGIDGGRIQTNSYGEEKPLVLGQSEAAYAKNRRAVLVY